MKKRKEKPENPKTLKFVGDGREDDQNEIRGKGEKGFFACYLLTSLCPRYKGHTYIGFTVNPRRRIRQHNGEISSGACRTKRRRPWEMVLCIYGFPTNISSLQFEWAWQHPMESLAVRQAAVAFKSFSGMAKKIKLAYTMLNLPTWQGLNITVNYFSTKYAHHGALCPSLPEQMKVRICSMDELPCYIAGDGSVSENDDSLNAEEQLEENEVSIPSIPGNRVDTANNNLTNDLGTLDDEQFVRDEEQEGEAEQTDQVDDCLTKVTSFSAEETVEETSSCGFVHKFSTELEEPRRTEFSAWSSFDEDQLHSPEENQPRNVAFATKDRSKRGCIMSDEVEVIDLLTPSPRCRVGSCSKKRRVPEIIDLTGSPNFIQI